MANNPFNSQKYQNFLNWFKDCKSNPYNQNTYLFGEGLSYYDQLSLIGSFLYDLKEYITTSDWTTGEELQAIIDQIEAEKQNVLISGENIKTINSESILTSGNLELQEKLIAGQNIVISPDGKTISASGTVGIDYPNVSNKPQINGHTLQSGNNTLDTLGIQEKDDTILFQDDVIDNLISEDTNLPLSANQGRVLDETKQDVLVSGSDIKTLNEIPILGEGNIPLKTLNGQSLIGSQDIPFKTVGSESIFGTGNIAFKTINSQSLMGEGNIPLQEVLTAGRGIDITNNVITNQFSPISSPDLNNIDYYYAGYVSSATNSPFSGSRSGFLLSIVNKNSTGYREQMFCAYNSDGWYLRKMTNSTWSSWRMLSDCYMAGDTVSNWGSQYPSVLGLCTNTNQIEFVIPLNKSVSASAVSFSNLTIRIWNATGTIVIDAIDVIADTSYTVTSSVVDNIGIKVVVKKNGIFPGSGIALPVNIRPGTSCTFA